MFIKMKEIIESTHRVQFSYISAHDYQEWNIEREN